MTCPFCQGTVEDGHTTVTVDTGDGVVVVRKVPARVCRQCGEDWIDDAHASQVEAIVAEAREKHTEIEVVALAS